MSLYSRSQLQHPQRPLGPGPARVPQRSAPGPVWPASGPGLLQEVQGRNEVSSVLHAQHESLAAASACRRPMAAMPSVPAPITAMPCCRALTSLDHENQDISDHRLEQRGSLHARIDVGGTEVHRFVVHLACSAGSRGRQIQAPDRPHPAIGPGRRAAADRGRLQRLGRPPGADKPCSSWACTKCFRIAPRSQRRRPRACATPVRRLGNVMCGVPNSVAVPNATTSWAWAAPIVPLGAAAADFPGGVPVVPPGSHLTTRGFSGKYSARVLRGREWARLSDHSAAAGRARIAGRARSSGCTGPMVMPSACCKTAAISFRAMRGHRRGAPVGASGDLYLPV